MTAEVWMVERWDRNVDSSIAYELDQSEGVYLDRELAVARVAELNRAEQVKVEEKAERDYRERLAAWQRSRADHAILVAAGARQRPFTLMEPQPYTLTRTIDEYRVSEPLELHTSKEG